MFENKYPYTDFSQLNLDWFLLKFKELLEEQERVSGKVKDLDDTVKEFTDFVTNYFDDLDVQQEINNKLNEMAADGTLTELIAPLVGDDIQDSVTDWLDEHVDPVGSAVIVDSSLSISGAAADAKAAGDKISEVKGALTFTENAIGTDSNELVAVGVSEWKKYQFRLYAGVQYTIAITGVSGTNYIQFLDKNDIGVINEKTITADTTFTQIFSRDVYTLKIFSANGLAISETHTGVYSQLNTINTQVSTNTTNIAKNTEKSTHTENAIGTDGNILTVSGVSDWRDYQFRLYGGCKYRITVNEFTGTAYVRFLDKNDTVKLSKELTASTTFDYTFDTDIYNVRVFTASGCTVSETHTGVYELTKHYPEYSVKDHTMHVVTVGKDGTKDYTTIASALAAITDSAIHNQYEVVIYPGVYNEKGLTPPDYVHIHGIQANLVTVTSEGLTGSDPVFDMTNHTKLSNMRIISGTGYCIHVDRNLNYGTVVCEGLYCEKLSRETVVGIGSWSGGALYIFRGCTFVNGPVGAHTYYNNSDVDNTHMVFDGCTFISSYIDLGLAAGLGNNICEIIAMKTDAIYAESLRIFYNDYRTIDEPDTYYALPMNWNIIGHSNEYFIANLINTRHGLMVQAVEYNKAVSISGTAVDVLFGVTKVKGASSLIKGAVYGTLRVDDVQAGAGTTERPYVDRFQMWKRLGDCSDTNKTLTVTVDGVSQTYTFDQDYTSTKPSEETLLAAINAVITNAVVSAYSPDCMEMVNTTDKTYVKVQQSEGITKGTFVTYAGTIAGANYTKKLIKGLALEDGVNGEIIPVWCGNAMNYTGSDGEYGIGSGGQLSADATVKIGYIASNRFYMYAF